MNVAVLGSINVDLVGRVGSFAGRDQAVEMREFTLDAGGHAGNTAHALARLGVPVRLIGSVGQDALGELALSGLREYGVDISCVARSAGPTGMACVPVTSSGERALYVAPCGNRLLNVADCVRGVEGCSGVVVCDPPPIVLDGMLHALVGKPAIWAPGGLVEASRESLTRVLRLMQFLILNGPECAALTDGASAEDGAAELVRRFGVGVIVTVGAEGCWYASRGQPARHFASFDVPVNDTTGAGDAFVAGFAAGIWARASIEDAIRQGCASGALAVRRLGAQAGHGTREEVRALVEGGATRPPQGAPAPVRPVEPARLPLACGADGWRGVIGEGFTVDAVAELGACIVAELPPPTAGARLLIAHDARFQSAAAARRLEQVLGARGVPIVFAGQLATPVASFAVRHRGYSGALIVTASHNPFYWNGLKLKVAPGMAPPRRLEAAIEARRRAPAVAPPESRYSEPIEARAEDLERELLEALLAQVPIEEFRARRFRVAVDGLHGVAGGVAARVLAAAGCSAHRLAPQVDPFFGGLVPDPTKASARARMETLMRGGGFDVGVVFDGDGDRAWFVDATGRSVQPQDTLALLIEHVVQRMSSPSARLSLRAVALTVTTGSIAARAARSLGLSVLETPVGFKHISPLLAGAEAFIGGGHVGDFGLAQHSADRDPLLGMLLVLHAMLLERQPLERLVADLHARHGCSFYRSFTLADSTRAPRDLVERALEATGLVSRVVSVSDVDGHKFALSDGGWILARTASTEAGVRVHIEAPDEARGARLLSALSQ